MGRIYTKPSSDPRLASWTVPPPYVSPYSYLKKSPRAAILFRNWRPPFGKTSAAQHLIMFQQMNCAASQMRSIYYAAQRRFNPLAKVKYDEWSLRYTKIREYLTEENIGLAYRVIGERHPESDLEEVSSDVMFAYLRSIDSFDPWRGFQFSTYAMNACQRAVYRLNSQYMRRHSLITGVDDYDGIEPDIQLDRKLIDNTSFWMERLKGILEQNSAGLTDQERDIINRRFMRERCDTLDSIGADYKVSKERIRQVQIEALTKIRIAVDIDPLLF